MRKIEALMNQAITNCKDWKLDNTRVTYWPDDDVSIVDLYGNIIAKIGQDWLQLFDGGHRSVTTKSRLNAILRVHGNGQGIYQKNFAWFMSTEQGDVPFVSGMKI